MSVRPHGTTRLQLGGFFFFENLSRKFKFHSNVTGTTVLYNKTYVQLWWYLAEFFLEWEMFHTKVVEKIQTHILCPTTVFRILCRLWDNVEKCGTSRQVTNDNIILRMHFVCCISKATDTHSKYVIFIAFLWQRWLWERVSMLLF